ncbi:MAG TPA: hypothetical protein VL393_06830 [Candidatus Binataceae bacterium]|nr:hypothetical protein [Candidatus Binataceae bacterium]
MAGPSLIVTVALAVALTAGGEEVPVLPNPFTVTVSVIDPSDPVKLPAKLQSETVCPTPTVCGSVHEMLVAQVLPATLLGDVHKLPAGHAFGSTQVPPEQFASLVQELPLLLPPEQAPEVAILPYLLSQT